MRIKPVIISILLSLAMTLSIQAHGQFNKPLKSQKQNTNLAFSAYSVGVTIGCPWSYMPKSDLTGVTYKGNFGYSLGIVLERFFSQFSLSLEGLFSQKGTRMYYEMPYQMSLNEDGLYTREFRYGYNLVSVRLPFSYYLKGTFKNDVVVPYVFIGPQVDFPLPFNAAFQDGNFQVGPATSLNVTQYNDGHSEVPATLQLDWNASVLAGVGLMTTIPTELSAIMLKFNVAFNYGLINQAWKKKEGESPLNMFLTGDKCIRSHDVEANLTVIFPIKKHLKDACYYLQ